MNPILQGALRGVGVLIVIGIGIIGLNYTAPAENSHGVSEIAEFTDTIQTNISTLQQEISNLKSDTTNAEAILQLQQEILTLTEQMQDTEANAMKLIPLGSLIATNGSLPKTEMNAQGRALCDGSEIISQVPDAIIKGTTLNLAGRTLVGEGTYAKDDTSTFQLGHVDEYKIGTITHTGTILHKLTFAEMPYHTHGINVRNHQEGTNADIITPVDRYSMGSLSTTIDTLPAGGDQSHNNMPPFHVVQYYIKVK